MMKKFGIIIGASMIFLIAFGFLMGSKTEVQKETVQEEVKDETPVQEISVRVDGTEAPGYFISQKTVRKGSRVRLNFVTDNEQGCARAISIPSKNVSQVLPESGLTPIEFNVDSEGDIGILCGMGMYWTVLKVVA